MLPPRLTALALLVAATLPSAHAATDVVWTETVITDHSDVDLDGTLVLAYNASNDTGNISVTVDGILYAAMPPGVLTSGWTGGTPYNYCIECTGAFNTLMDSLVYNPDNTVTGIDLDGLVIGQSYKVQLLMSNDQNTTGATEQWSLGGVSYVQDGWALPGRNETVILSATFTATQTTEAAARRSRGTLAPIRAHSGRSRRTPRSQRQAVPSGRRQKRAQARRYIRQLTLRAPSRGEAAA